MADTQTKPPRVQEPLHVEHGPALAVPAQPYEREWDGNICDCCDGCSCREKGWPLCCLTYWCTCVTFGFNSRDGLGKPFYRELLIFLCLFILPGLIYTGVQIPRGLRQQHCLLKAEVDYFNHYNATDIADSAGNLFLQRVDKCNQYGVQVGSAAYVILTIFYYTCAIAGWIYVTVHRLQMRKKLGIAPCCEGGGSADAVGECCLVCWCMGCMLCQERRTLMKYNIHNGVVAPLQPHSHGGPPGQYGGPPGQYGGSPGPYGGQTGPYGTPYSKATGV